MAYAADSGTQQYTEPANGLVPARPLTGIFNSTQSSYSVDTGTQKYFGQANGLQPSQPVLAIFQVTAPIISTGASYTPTRLPNKFVGPMALRHNFRTRTPVATARLPVVYSQGLSGNLSFTGAEKNSTSRVLSGSLSFTGSTNRVIVHVQTAVLSFSGALGPKTISRLLAATTSFTGSFTKQPQKVLVAGLSPNNLILNGSFETAPSFVAATNTTNKFIDGTATGSTTISDFKWVLLVNAAAFQAQFDSTTSHSGNASIKLSCTNATGRGIVRLGGNAALGSISASLAQSLLVRIQPNTTYSISAWIKTNNAATGAVNALWNRFDSSFTAIGSNFTVLGSNNGTQGWTLQTTTVTTGATDAYMGLFLNNNVAGNISDAWFDDITITPSIVLSRQVNKSLTATQSFTGAMKRLTAYPLTATTSFMGTLSSGGHTSSQAFAASLSFVGSVRRQANRPLTASLSFAGSQVKNIAKALAGYVSFIIPPDSTDGGLGSGYFGGSYYGQGYTGPLPSGFTKQTNKALVASVSSNGSISKATNRPLSANLSFAGSMSRNISKALTASLSFVGTMRRSTAHALTVATLAFTGGFLAARGLTLRSFTGSLGFGGSIGRTTHKSLVASLSPAGAIRRLTSHNLTATVSPTGTTTKSSAKTFTAVTGFSGSMRRVMNKTLRSTLSPVGFFLNVLRRHYRPTKPIYLGQNESTIYLNDGGHTIYLGNISNTPAANPTSGSGNVYNGNQDSDSGYPSTYKENYT